MRSSLNSLFLFGVVLLGGALLSAEERTEDSFIPNYAVASSYFSWGGESDFETGTGSLGLLEYGAEANVPILMQGGFRMTAGARYRHNTLDFSGAPAPLASTRFDLHRVDLPVNVWIDMNQRWKLWARLQPGWYSDFETVTSDDFILTSLVLLSYKWSETTKVAFGAFYSRDLGEERILPAVGLIYEPNPHLSLALTFPRVELAYAPNCDWLFTSRAVLNGAGWNISDPAGSNLNVDLNYRAIRAGFGIDHRIAGPCWFYLDGGVQLGQEVEIEGGANPVKLELEPSPFVNSGVKVRF